MIWILGMILACGNKEMDTSSTDEPVPEPETTETAPEPQPTSEPESTEEPESQPTTEPDSEPTFEGDVAAGEILVQSTCMGYCHSSNPAIENSGSMTEEELRNLFANGQGYMPAQNLTEQETLDVIAYLWATYDQ